MSVVPLHRECASFNILTPDQYGRHFADDIFQCRFKEKGHMPYRLLFLFFIPGLFQYVMA